MAQNDNKQPSEFLIITKAKDLVKHTFAMTSEKRYPKKYRALTERLYDRTLDIFECVEEANELQLSDPREFAERQRLQGRILTLCKTVLFFIELSHERGCISIESSQHWAKYVLDVKYMTAKWKKQEKERRGIPR
ncbi:MAG: four helix bundle protein [Oscillospiraceae bacterium]|nr:four helix bundle protein [Oscillospiraceae bacterium]